MCIVQKKFLLSLLVSHLSIFSAQGAKTPPCTPNYKQFGMRQTNDFISPDESPVSKKTQISPSLKHPEDYLVGEGFDSELDVVFRGVRLSGDLEEMSPLTLPQALGEVDTSSSRAESSAMQIDQLRPGSFIRSVGFDDFSEFDEPARRGTKRPQTPGVIKDGIVLYKKAAQERDLLVRSASVDSQETKNDNDASPRSFTPVCSVKARRKVFVCPAILERNKPKFPDRFAQAEAKE